jgi:protein FAM32A
MAPTTFMGGKLNLKGDKKKKKKIKKKSNHASKHSSVDQHHQDRKLTDAASSSQHQETAEDSNIDDTIDDGLTEAERKSTKFKSDKQLRDLEKATSMSHRQRVDQFNEGLSKLTEHNDIPRVSAAGNG